MPEKEGVIKFSYSLQGNRDDFSKDLELIYWRDFLWRHNLIGVDENGYGFGNVSIRLPKGFLITGSQTGHIPSLKPKHLVHIIDWDFQNNTVVAKGEWKPSSESLTHAAAYGNPEVFAVVHSHNNPAWEYWKDKAPTTDPNIPYGTVEMAQEIKNILGSEALPVFVVMGGHYGGLLTIGGSLWEAVALMIDKVYENK
ncbi:MAG: class II aldolase/adducin family protein [Chlorobi bacterium]|nr:class II aldolase/adducin family protein [Chlorobiota bacterium]